MIEQKGNLWDFHDKGEWIVITTNGTIKKNGEVVMGRGCALEAKIKYPDIPKILGSNLRQWGNRPFYVGYKIITLPVKINWWEYGNLNLIEESIQTLVDIINENDGINKIYMPRPGCGNGKLDWESQVKPLCEKYLDERFMVLTK